MSLTHRTRYAVPLFALCVVACEVEPPPAGRPVADPLVAGADSVRELGPFRIGGVPHAVLLDIMRWRGEATVLRFRLADSAGVDHVTYRFDVPDTTRYGLRFTVSVTPVPVTGSAGDALLVYYEYLPAAPLTGVTLQTFAPVRGRVQALHAPLDIYGRFDQLTGHDGARALRAGDIMLLSAWRYYFAMEIPVALDLRCDPATAPCVAVRAARTDSASGHGIYAVRAEPSAAPAAAFVSLYEAPGARTFDRVPIRAGTRVEVLNGAAEVRLRGEETLEVVVRDEWLRVRIGTREGWVTGPADFEAIGLAPAAQ